MPRHDVPVIGAICRTGLSSLIQSPRHSGNSVLCPRSVPSTKPLIRSSANRAGIISRESNLTTRFYTTRVISGARRAQPRCPLYPDEPTSSAWPLTSEKCQHRTSSPDKGISAQSRKVSTNDLSSRCFSLAYECWGKDRMGAELLPTATSIGRHYITADLDGRAIPRFQVCLIASKRMLEFTRQVSFARTSGRRTWVRRGRWTRFLP